MPACLFAASLPLTSCHHKNHHNTEGTDPARKSQGNLNASGLGYWGDLWQGEYGPAGYWKAWDAWFNQKTPEISLCPSTLEHNWPPTK
jgi:hypothetical protein